MWCKVQEPEMICSVHLNSACVLVFRGMDAKDTKCVLVTQQHSNNNKIKGLAVGWIFQKCKITSQHNMICGLCY